MGGRTRGRRKGKRGSGKGGDKGKSGVAPCLLIGAYTLLPAVTAATEQWAWRFEAGCTCPRFIFAPPHSEPVKMFK